MTDTNRLEAEERIEKEAIKYVIQETGYRVLPEHDHWKNAYIAGATSEHPKAWNEAIDACKNILKKNTEDRTRIVTVYDLLDDMEQLKKPEAI